MKWIILLVCGLTAVSSQWCRTPAPFNEDSSCISLKDCPIYVSAFQRRPLTSNIINFLRKSQCGFIGNIPKVCCGSRLPSEETEIQPLPLSTSEAVPNSAEVIPSVREDSVPTPRGQCGIDSDSDRIYGGELTDLDEFPWMVLLGYRTATNKVSYQCGGVLINKRYVLTAAHCVIGNIITAVGVLVTARLGEYDIQTSRDCLELGGRTTCAEPHQDIPVHRAIPHPGYNPDNTNKRDDIAVVRLADRARYNGFVQPICLADSRLRLSTGDDMFVAGWGKTLSGTNSPIKLKLRVPVYDKTKCARIFLRNQAVLTDRQICAGGEFAKDACRGDSGGPLMRNNQGVWEVYGIVSFGRGCGLDDIPGVYTNVQSYLDWIKDTIQYTN